MSTALAKVPASATLRYDAMCVAIAAAHKVDEVKDIRDQARAFEVYAQQAKNVEAERQACEIRLRAERKAGTLLVAREKAKGGQPKKNPSHAASTSPAPLADLGISHTQSANWQKLAAVPDVKFEQAVTKPGPKPTTSGIIAGAAKPTVNPVDPMALWLWGRLQDFGRQGLLAADPNALLATMLPHMRDTTIKLAPLVAAWLRRLET